MPCVANQHRLCIVSRNKWWQAKVVDILNASHDLESTNPFITRGNPVLLKGHWTFCDISRKQFQRRWRCVSLFHRGYCALRGLKRKWAHRLNRNRNGTDLSNLEVIDNRPTLTIATVKEWQWRRKIRRDLKNTKKIDQILTERGSETLIRRTWAFTMRIVGKTVSLWIWGFSNVNHSSGNMTLEPMLSTFFSLLIRLKRRQH